MKGLVALLLLALTALPALATQDRWPSLFDVTGVAADDVLNIRAAPDAGAPIIGTLDPDATSVEILEPNDRHTWGKVNTQEGTGWINLSFVRLQPGQFYGAVPERALCHGTEPFWSLRLDDGTMTYEAMDAGAPQVGRIDAVSQSLNHPGRSAVTGIFERTEDSQFLDGVAMLSNEACSDGMSDRAYGFRVDLILGNIEGFEMRSGCCSLVGD